MFTYLIQKFGRYLNEMVIQPDTRIVILESDQSKILKIPIETSKYI